MQDKEVVISRVYSPKTGELIVSFKHKFGEWTLQERADFELLCREGIPLKITIDRFQEINPT